MSTEKIMEQAQVFASAWSVVGGPFDGGDAMEVATQEKDELRRMVAELVEERDALAAKLKDAEHDRDEFRRVMNGFAEKMAELEGQTDNLLSTCHRLALELECLLLDTKDSATVSRWWDSAMAALDEWHKVKDSVSAEQPVNARLLEAIKRLSFCAQTTGGTAGRDEGLCAAIGEAEKAIVRAAASTP